MYTYIFFIYHEMWVMNSRCGTRKQSRPASGGVAKVQKSATIEQRGAATEVSKYRKSAGGDEKGAQHMSASQPAKTSCFGIKLIVLGTPSLCQAPPRSRQDSMRFPSKLRNSM